MTGTLARLMTLLITVGWPNRPSIAGKGGFVTLPERWHAPLRQRMALVKGAGEAARRFHDFIRSPEARAIFARHGFALPAEN